jgi:hypothetical protein
LIFRRAELSSAVGINLRVSFVIATAMLVVAGVAPCLAQAPADPQENPNPQERQTFDATVSLTAAYDSDVAGWAPAGAAQFFGPEAIAHSNQFSTTAEYRWSIRDVEVRASGTSAWLQDRQTGTVAGLSRSAAAGLTARLPWRTTLLFNQTAVSSPSNLYNLFPRAAVTGPGAAPPTAHDYGANHFDSSVYNARATLTHEATRRLGFSFNAIGELSETASPSTAAGPSELESYELSGRFAHLLTRNTRTTGQYSYRAGSFQGSNVAPVIGLRIERGLRIAEHTVEIGLTHSRPLSRSRRTVFNVVAGGVVVRPLEQPLAGPLRLTESYRLIGQAGAEYLFRKTWQVGAMYRRGVDYVPGLSEPVLTDGLTARIGGFFTRRIDVVGTAGYASGVSALKLAGPRFDTYTSEVRLRVALNPAVSVYGEYLYYLYDFRRYAPLMPGMPPALERNGLRVGLTLTVPTLDW